VSAASRSSYTYRSSWAIVKSARSSASRDGGSEMRSSGCRWGAERPLRSRRGRRATREEGLPVAGKDSVGKPVAEIEALEKRESIRTSQKVTSDVSTKQTS
jgi:hypothetical protein